MIKQADIDLDTFFYIDKLLHGFCSGSGDASKVLSKHGGYMANYNSSPPELRRRIRARVTSFK